MFRDSVAVVIDADIREVNSIAYREQTPDVPNSDQGLYQLASRAVE